MPKNNRPSLTKVDIGNNLSYSESDLIDKESPDYDSLKKVAEELVKAGFKDVTLTPDMSRPSAFDYDCFYSELRGTKYDGKCPDIKANGVFYEVEGYNTNNPKRALSNMLSRGLKQSDRVIIDEVDLTDTFIKRCIRQRIIDGDNISEVWMREGSGIRLIYKKFEER